MIISTAADRGHLKVIAFWHTSYRLNNDEVRSTFLSTMLNGHLSILQFLKEEEYLSRADILADKSLGIQWASGAGHIHILTFLIDQFKLTLNDIELDAPLILKAAAKKGQVPVLKFLQKRFPNLFI